MSDTKAKTVWCGMNAKFAPWIHTLEYSVCDLCHVCALNPLHSKEKSKTCSTAMMMSAVVPEPFESNAL